MQALVNMFISAYKVFNPIDCDVFFFTRNREKKLIMDMSL